MRSARTKRSAQMRTSNAFGDGGGPTRALLRKLGWLALLWTASVAALTAVALPLRWLLKAI